MKIYLLISFLLLANIAPAQELIKVNISTEDPYHYYINDKESTDLFYYKMVPEHAPIGALVLLPSAGESIESMLNQTSLHHLAVENNLLVVMPSYNMGTIQQEPELEFFDLIFKQLVDEHQVSKDRFIFCGLSKGAMISLTYGVRAVRDSNRYLVPKGIIGLDPPVDLARLYRYCEREIKRNFSEAGVAEAKWLKSVYEQVYGGSPDSVPSRYQEASVFTYGAEKGGNAQYLNNIALRMHTDLNVDFLINQRKRDLYDWNGTDLVAFINQVKVNGNKQAEVIITRDKGKRPDGSANPHSWSIMDADSTMEWMLDLLKSDKTNIGEDKAQETKRYELNDRLPKSNYLEDLDQLVDSIRINHPQPYEFISKSDFDNQIALIKASITDSTTISEFAWICNSIAATVGCLHTSTNSRNINFSPNQFFPVKVHYSNAKLFVTAPDALNTELTRGTEILSINGVDIAELKNGISRHISSDGYNQGFIDAIINRYFGYFAAFQLNFPPVYKVEVMDGHARKELLINHKTPDETEASESTSIKDLDFSIDPAEQIAKIGIKSFVYYDERLPIFKSFIDSCFTQIEQNNIGNVVIDLRDNGGGDPFCAAHLLQYISKKSFRYYKKGSTTYYKSLEKKINPFKNRFKGNLFVLINSGCASTTGHLSSILKYNHIGILIGSETGATYSCNANNITFKLKHSGIDAFVATKIYQTDVSGFKKSQGIVPDYPVLRSIDDILSERDVEMEKVRELIKIGD